MSEPTEKHIREAQDILQSLSPVAPWITVAFALAAAEERGRRAGLEEAALLPRTYKLAENVRAELGSDISDDSVSDIAWIATIIEGDIRALIPKEKP